MGDTDEPHIRYFHMGPWPIYVGFTMAKKAFRKEMKRLKCSGVDFLASDHANATTHTFERSGGLTFIVTLGDINEASPEQVAGMIAHEAMHVAQIAWEHLGERNPGAESEAYFVQYVTQCCLQEAYGTGRVRSYEPTGGIDG